MSDTLHESLGGLDDCGCCAGPGAGTPLSPENPEGRETLHYRIGTYDAFRRSMLAALTGAGAEPLHGLATRDPDDFSIALLDAWAVVADILTFYQERLAHESYLRTALDEASVRRLARLIGYRPAPGVAASAWLAFTLDPSPGAPGSATLASGLRVQSVPGQDEDPQTFETVETIEARAEWNALRPRLTEPFAVVPGQTELYLAGTATQLQKGDAILIVGDERELNPTSWSHDERWDMRTLTRVEPDTANDRTRVSWDAGEGLGHGDVDPAAENVRVYAFRQRGALFGHNAPDPNLMTVESALVSHLFDVTGGVRSWKNHRIRNDEIDLDAAYPKLVAGGWLVLQRMPESAEDRGYAELYRALDVSFPSRTQYGLSSKVTRIRPDTNEHLGDDFFPLGDTIAYFASEELATAEPPLRSRAEEAPSRAIDLDPDSLAPLEGSRIELSRQITPLEPGRVLIVSGKRIRVLVDRGVDTLELSNESGGHSEPLAPGESLVVLEPPAIDGSQVSWRLRRDDGFEGTVETTLNAPSVAGGTTSQLLLTAAGEDDETVSEQVTVDDFEVRLPTRITLGGNGLRHLYDRATVTIAANVALGTHGETTEEVAGGGDASRAFQRFALKQAPLTYLPGSGTALLRSTLEVRVDDLLWREVASFFQAGGEDRVFTVRPGDGQSTEVLFGDGRKGARLPTGQRNVRFRYRHGSGLGGMVRAGQLSQLLSRPLGLQGVSNPLAAEGADEPEALEDARRNAPLTVLTLGRVVSLQDYEDFSRAYPGIGKALATWTWDGRQRGVLVTVAGPGGLTIEPGGLVEEGLAGALRASGDPFVPIRVLGFEAASFTLGGSLTIDEDHEDDLVLEAVKAELRRCFGFDARAFGQPVHLSEVLGVIQSVAGVVAVDLDHLQRGDLALAVDPAPRLDARMPLGGGPAVGEPAELLLLDSAPLDTLIASSS